MTVQELRAASAKASDAYYFTKDAWDRGVQGVTASQVLAAKREAMAAIRAWEASLQG